VSRVNIVKRIKSDGRWKMLSIPRNPKGNYDWNALPDLGGHLKTGHTWTLQNRPTERNQNKSIYTPPDVI